MVALKEALVAQPQDNPKETTVEADDKGSTALRAETRAEFKLAVEAVVDAATQRDKAAEICSSSTQTF